MAAAGTKRRTSAGVVGGVTLVAIIMVLFGSPDAAVLSIAAAVTFGLANHIETRGQRTPTDTNAMSSTRKHGDDGIERRENTNEQYPSQGTHL